ncbi:MAG: hypothetical protein JSV90_01515 [Methanobacteriota archaeon]|nr:MAG: hypothetical protein JSV90_01515 [Euryarchaeota archaeon]
MNSNDRGATGRRTSALAVLLGMALFIVGFGITLSSLPSDSAAGTQGSGMLDDAIGNTSSDGAAALLLVGLIISMAGVIVATAIPAAVFLQGARRGT